MSKKDTSWTEVAEWYDEVVEGSDSYQQKVILPNVLRLLAPRTGMNVLDLACGQGFFSREFVRAGASVVGVDLGVELINIAKAKDPRGTYHVSAAHTLPFLDEATVDATVIVLALQNIKEPSETVTEVSRVLKPGGELIVVLNHPAFRIPKRSSWGFDEEAKVQYRRLDGYMSESTSSIEMHPGQNNSSETISFHRPLQVYFKAFAKAGLAVTKLEEWVSHKTSEAGPRAKPENISRKEFPLFLALVATKL